MFGMGLEISEADEASTRGLQESAYKSMTCINDYYSYDREYEMSKRLQFRERMMNGVEVLMRVESVSAPVAKDRIKAIAIEYEIQFTRQKELYYSQNPNLSLDMRRWIQALESVIAGNAYWYDTGRPKRCC